MKEWDSVAQKLYDIIISALKVLRDGEYISKVEYEAIKDYIDNIIEEV